MVYSLKCTYKYKYILHKNVHYFPLIVLNAMTQQTLKRLFIYSKYVINWLQLIPWHAPLALAFIYTYEWNILYNNVCYGRATILPNTVHGIQKFTFSY